MCFNPCIDEGVPFNPSYENHCWHCKAPIDDWSCLNAGFDETGSLGYECNVCGRHLGHKHNPGKYPLFQMATQLNNQLLESQCA